MYRENRARSGSFAHFFSKMRPHSLYILILVCILDIGRVAGQPTARVFQSAEGNGDRLRKLPDLQFSKNNFLAPEIIRINITSTYQTILGFGGAFTEASAYVIGQMPANKQTEIFNAYFGDKGHKYTVGRIPIGSCDFSIASYNFDNVTNDYTLENFSIDHDRKYIIPYVQRALKVSSRPIKLYASPWSPPGWMKGNGQMDGSSTPCLKKDPAIHKSWALYLSKFLNAYKDEGTLIIFSGLVVHFSFNFRR